ncbi:MAG TPA: sigma-70 family RNA polymerase sigma factor [Gemmataceae bacterium]|nr:sigma-70 family RNA polymerase sigma factor [Gemmataceae bacterium]
MAEVQPDSAETRELLERVANHDAGALEELLVHHRAGLRDFIEFHLDPRLRARVDPSDVVQETQMELVRRMEDFLARRPMPFRLWMRRKAYERLLNLRRNHLVRERRSVRREIAFPDQSSLALARPLLAKQPTPSQEAEGRELAEQIARAVAHLADADREILLLRQAQELPFEEIAVLLNVEAGTARKRFGRALIRLQTALREEGLLKELP